MKQFSPHDVDGRAVAMMLFSVKAEVPMNRVVAPSSTYRAPP